ncbi:MAG: hypothetical protein KDC23_13085, partial [Actinobacteria bacterium]|nr:hypothetical protein [Actinomycetota bacterium]
ISARNCTQDSRFTTVLLPVHRLRELAGASLVTIDRQRQGRACVGKAIRIGRNGCEYLPAAHANRASPAKVYSMCMAVSDFLLGFVDQNFSAKVEAYCNSASHDSVPSHWNCT